MSLHQLRQRGVDVTREVIEYAETVLFVIAWAADLVREERRRKAR